MISFMINKIIFLIQHIKKVLKFYNYKKIIKFSLYNNITFTNFKNKKNIYINKNVV